MKKTALGLILVLSLIFFNSANAKNKNDDATTTISNRYFSIEVPKELDGTYSVKKRRKGIFLYHKESEKAGFGGFTYGLMLFKKPNDHANMPGGRKVGELKSFTNTLYDMVLVQPTDVQYDYTKSEKAPEGYKKLYDMGNYDKYEIKGRLGSKYYKDQGMKGKDLYGEILEKHIKAIKEKWDSNKLEEENMSYMYNVIAQTNKNPLDKIGYIYADINADGIDELLIGEIAKGSWKGIVYDIYTMVDRKPEHVVSGGTRDRYFICDGTFVCEEYSSGALESGLGVFILEENSTELFHQVSFKYDGYENKKNPWFIMYTPQEGWCNMKEKEFKERRKVFEQYERYNFIPFRSLVNKK